MKLVIQIENGQPVHHPMLWDNFLQYYPDANWDNLPEGFAKFERVPEGKPPQFHHYAGATYEWDGDTVKDVHHYNPMTEEEKQEYITLLRNTPHGDMVFNETTFMWEDKPE